jgi:hypothetical protein
MTRAVWLSTIGVAVLLVAGWSAAVAASRAPKLRSEHSQPAAVAPAVVAVTEQGKLFHRADCAFIHGPVRSEPGEQAIAEGYTACTRCMKR